MNGRETARQGPGVAMRRLWAAGAAMSLCLTFGGVSTKAQDASPGAGSSPDTSTAVTPGTATWVTGTADCYVADLGDQSIDADGVQHFRDGTFKCQMRTDDPRVSGTHSTTTWNADIWGASDVNRGEVVQWATVRLENEGGVWEGRLTGVASLADVGDNIIIWYKGSGGYAGLSYFEQWVERDPWTVQGLIFPGDPPTP
jgi:hypothetical protein